MEDLLYIIYSLILSNLSFSIIKLITGLIWYIVAAVLVYNPYIYVQLLYVNLLW